MVKELRNTEVHETTYHRHGIIGGMSDTSLLDPNLIDLYFFLRSVEKRVSGIVLASVRSSGSPILSVCSHSTEPLEDPHSGFHPPKYRVFVVKEWRRSKGEEELGTCGYSDGACRGGENTRTVGVGAGVSHCKDPCTREPQFWIKLIFATTGHECLTTRQALHSQSMPIYTSSSSPSAGGVACLYHKVLDNDVNHSDLQRGFL